MKNVSSIILLAVSLLAVCVIPARAQVAAVGSPTPCPDEQLPGRPTLKRRQTNSDDRAGASRSATVPCEPNNLIKSEVRRVPVKFVGLVNVNESDLRHYIRGHYGEESTASSAANFQDLNVITSLVKKFLENSGYRHPRVTPQPATTNESADPILVIEEGARPRIASYDFKGNRVFSTSQLAGELDRCMTGYDRDYYDADVFEYCRHQLHNFARSQGYAKAEFHDPRISETDVGLIITLIADEGILYRVGKIRLDGDLMLAADRVPIVCPLKAGDVMNGELFSKWLFDDLKKSYWQQGYIQYTADVTPEFRTTNRGDGLIDLIITIDSGKRFKLQHIQFAGENLPDNLAALMLIHEGDIYNQTLFERSIETLNNTGQFEFIDKDKDVDFRSNDEEGLLDLAIKLKRKTVSWFSSSQLQPANAINLRT
jgi:outer membrane protein assembly factor BamA